MQHLISTSLFILLSFPRLAPLSSSVSFFDFVLVKKALQEKFFVFLAKEEKEEG